MGCNVVVWKRSNGGRRREEHTNKRAINLLAWFVDENS
jgi:hypothetical protein